MSDCNCVGDNHAKGCEIGDDCCKVEAVVGIDARGQMVLPKEVREKAGIEAGDKLALISWGDKSKARGLCLVKSNAFDEVAKKIINPIVETR